MPNRPCTKSFESGTRSLLARWAGPCLVSLFLGWALPNPAHAYPERQGWIIEQLARPPRPTGRTETRYQGTLSLANYLDTLSVQGSGILDLRYFELGIKASSRVFLELSDRGKEARAQLADRQYTVAGEISRYYSSPLGPYGRLGLELAHFFPENKQWAHLAVDTGFRETPSLPWSLEIAIHMFFSLQGNQRFLVASNRTAKEIGRWETSALKVGGFFSWVNRMREVGRPGNQPSASFEHMLFSLGPYAELKSGAGQLALSLPLRLWLDKEIFQRAGNDVTSYPSELTQDLTLVWSVFF